MTVYELERRMIPTEELDNTFQDGVPKCIEDALGQPWGEFLKEGIPTGIGHTEETGWFILMSGQGPFIFWIEKEDQGVYRNANDGRRDEWVPKKS